MVIIRIMEENLDIIMKSIELLDITLLLDIIRKKYYEQTEKTKSLKESNDILINENKELLNEITNLKNKLEKSSAHFLKDEKHTSNNFQEKSEFKIELPETSDEDDFKNVIAETFCSEIDETHISLVENSFGDSDALQSKNTSPIICSKFKKSNFNKSSNGTSLQDKLWHDLDYVPETPNAYDSQYSFRNISKKCERLPLVSTENSPKSKLKKTVPIKSPTLLQINNINKTEQKNINRLNLAKTKEKEKNKRKRSANKNVKLKQISVMKSFRKSIHSSPDNVFNFENSDILNENIYSNLQLNESATFMDDSTSSKPVLLNELNKDLLKVRKKLKYNSSEDEQFEKNEMQITSNSKKGENKEASFLFVRDAIKKKSERKKLQGWACDECKKYYEGANLTESQLQAKINECSRHRDNHNPFANNTPPGYWNPEFPPTQELNRTQKGHKITNK